MSRTTRKRWDKAARLEPYYSVLARPEFLMTNAADSRQAFFDSGERDVDALLQFIRSVAPHHRIERVLEFGCGPGRLLAPFARRGFDVTGADNSPAMLDVARANLASYEITNVQLVDVDELARSRAQFDVINVVQVLQAIDSDETADTLRTLARLLAPGGFVHLTFPFRTTRSGLSQFVLQAREAVPPLNAAFNRMRKRPPHTPLFRPRVHSLDEVLALWNDANCDVVRLSVAQEGELTTADIVLRKRAVSTATAVESTTIAAQPDTADGAQYIDPRDLIAKIGIEELHARAEAYFASSDDWDQQLAKPFGSLTDAPPMLVSLGVLLQVAELRPGMTVLDFGGGTGWLSRFLLQLGCHVILADVAPSALRIATEFIERQPPLGKHRGQFRTALFDGFHLPIESEEVDRILCFDAFHHVPNVEQTLSEFARILKPGGLAAFSEPGPQHSRSAQSQFEMRVYGVLENDFDIHAIWRTARSLGFDDIRLVPFNGAPTLIGITEFEDLLARGPALQRAADDMRNFTANVRTMTLRKHGQERLDSRTAKGLAASIAIDLQSTPVANRPTPALATVKNIGKQDWLPSSVDAGGVSLGAHLYSRDGRSIDFNFLWQPLSDSPITPNQQIILEFQIPVLTVGEYVLEFDCVANGVTWFTQVGSRATRVEMHIDR